MNLPPRFNPDAARMAVSPIDGQSPEQLNVAMAQMRSRPGGIGEEEAATVANTARHLRRQMGLEANTREELANQMAQSYAAATLNEAGDGAGMGASGPMTRMGQLASAGVTPEQLAASLGY